MKFISRNHIIYMERRGSKLFLTVPGGYLELEGDGAALILFSSVLASESGSNLVQVPDAIKVDEHFHSNS